MNKERFFFVLKRVIQWFLIVLSWLLFVALIVSIFLIPYALLIVPLLFLFLVLYIKLNHRRLIKYGQADTIIYGSRGSGKGLIFQFLINNEKKVLSNMNYGPRSSIVSPYTFFESIKPNTFYNFITDTILKVDKVPDWEGIPYYLDDANVYFPNSEDTFLTKYFKSMSSFLTIQRHLYNSYTVINAQSIDRLYKKMRELNLDGYILALGGLGFSSSKNDPYIWNRLPVFRRFLVVKYRFYDRFDSAINGLLPFNKLGLVNRVASPLISTTPEALKEQYKATNGNIFDGFIFIRKKDIKYNTRYFASLVFKKND